VKIDDQKTGFCVLPRMELARMELLVQHKLIDQDIGKKLLL